MNKVTEYTIVWGFEIGDVIRDVNSLLKHGWKLHGPLVVNKVICYREMVREVDDPGGK